MGTVLVTGCDSGIGREFATQYADAGYAVVATYRDLANRLDDARMRHRALDVTDKSARVHQFHRNTLIALKEIRFKGWTEIFMHPTPRGIPILETATLVTAEINRARAHLDSLLAGKAH